jgi:hypothetical protein
MFIIQATAFYTIIVNIVRKSFKIQDKKFDYFIVPCWSSFSKEESDRQTLKPADLKWFGEPQFRQRACPSWPSAVSGSPGKNEIWIKCNKSLQILILL